MFIVGEIVVWEAWDAESIKEFSISSTQFSCVPKTYLKDKLIKKNSPLIIIITYLSVIPELNYRMEGTISFLFPAI